MPSAREHLEKLFTVYDPYTVDGDIISSSDILDPMSTPWASKIWTYYEHETQVLADRYARYKDFEEMDRYDPILSSCLTLYGEEAAPYDSKHDACIWADSEDPLIREELTAMLIKTRLDTTVHAIGRACAKYGDCFMRIFYKEGDGVLGLKYLSPYTVSRVEDPYSNLKGFKVTPKTTTISSTYSNINEKTGAVDALPWDILHFRMLGDRIDSLYGDSILEPARKIFKQMRMIEEALMLYRLQRAPDRIVYYIDTGKLPPSEAIKLVERWRNRIRRKHMSNPLTGEMKIEWHPYAIDEELFWPTREGSNSRVDKIPGGANVGDIEDINYFLNKLFAAIRVPKNYLGFEGDISARSALSMQDVKFSRSVRRLQRTLIEGVYRLCQIHLALKGINPIQSKFSINMTPISYLDEIQRSELFTTKLDTAERLARIGADMNFNRNFWMGYILTKFLDFTEEDVQRVLANTDRPPNTDVMRNPTAQDFAHYEPSDKYKLLAEVLASMISRPDGALYEQDIKNINELISTDPDIVNPMLNMIAKLKALISDMPNRKDYYKEKIIAKEIAYKRTFSNVDAEHGKLPEPSILMEQLRNSNLDELLSKKAKMIEQSSSLKEGELSDDDDL